jgi:hypothetical protein
MSRYVFPGFTGFLEEAARRIGRPEVAAPARRDSTLSALANLCAQAAPAGPEHARAILDKAAEFRDQLYAASQAADLMIDEVHQALGLRPTSNLDNPPAPGGRAPKTKTSPTTSEGHPQR